MLKNMTLKFSPRRTHVRLAAIMMILSSLVSAQLVAAAELRKDIWNEALAQRGIGAAPVQTRIIVFCDPNCPYCAKLWKQVEGGKSAASLTRWIPVAYLNASSKGRAGALLESAHPELALAENFRHYSFASRNGGVRPLANVSFATQTALSRNTTLWRSLGGITPLMLYRSVDGKIQLQPGLPTAGTIERILEESKPHVLGPYVKSP